MPRHLWLRIALVIAVVAGSVWYLYPPRKSINLGLDLQGGIHLVLGVDLDRYLENQVERTGSDIRAALEKKGIGIAALARQGNTEIRLQLANRESWNEALRVLDEFPSYERKTTDQATATITLGLRASEAARLRDDAVRVGLTKIRNRVDPEGMKEPTIQRQGENRILVELPGFEDAQRAKAKIAQVALLEFKLLDETADVNRALQGEIPEGDELLWQRDVDRKTKQERRVAYVVKKRAILTGELLQGAEVRPDSQTGEWGVSVDLNRDGARIFGEVTAQNVGKQLAIILDGNVYSAPSIRERIPSGQARITGNFTPEEARDLADVLRAGALPAPVAILEERTVGPSLGADSIRKGLISILASAAVVFAFMLVYYRLSGAIADVALLLNLLILMAAMAGFHATLTLPGIAGIALTIGMAVDTNILIFERIREELKTGKTVRAAIEAGFTRAFKTIIDTHVTVLVSAAILYQFGTGPVKGFAVSLAIGIAASLFTAVFFTRLLFDLIYMGRRRLTALSI